MSETLVTEARSRSPARISVAHPGPAVVIGDPDALARALRNLLDNAVRAGGDDGRILVEAPAIAHPRAGHRVSTTAPAYRPDERERIFEGFVRLNGSSSAGTGLGLAIARAIAHQHHGSVTCDDCETGAHFTLELPAAAPRLVERGDDLLEQVERVLEAVLHAGLDVRVAVLLALVVDEHRERRAPV